MAGGTIIDTARATARLLQKAGVDLISVSSGLHGSYPVIVPPYDQPKGVNVPLAESIKQEVSVPVAVAGRIDDLQLAEEILASGKADLVAMGRALLADPDLIEKSRSGRLGEIRHCIGCNVCYRSIANSSLAGDMLGKPRGRKRKGDGDSNFFSAQEGASGRGWSGWS